MDEDELLRESTLSKSVYINKNYKTSKQLLSFFNQIEQVFNVENLSKLENLKILEVGKGNGVVSSILKNYYCEVTTFDINPNLSPDVTGNIVDISRYFSEDYFDLILCCEVLEHAPFRYFDKAIEELHKIANYALITLPEFKRFYGIGGILLLPRYHRSFSLQIPFGFKKLPSEHFWEINSEKANSRQNVEKTIQKYFNIIMKGKFTFNNYHNYYMLKKLRKSCDVK